MPFPGFTCPPEFVPVPANVDRHAAFPAVCNQNSISIVIADERPLIIEGLRTALSIDNLDVINICRSFGEIPEAVANCRPDILVIGTDFPTETATILLRQISNLNIATRVVVMAERLNSRDLFGLTSLGVVGVVSQIATTDDIVSCVKTVAMGKIWVQSDIAQVALHEFLGSPDRPSAKTLTPQQRKILALVASGLRNKEIAKDLNITEGTVKIHIHAIFRRLGIRSRAELEPRRV